MKDLIKKLSLSFRKFWPYLAIFLLILFFFWKTVFKSLIPFPGDFIVGMYYPWLDYKWGYEVGVPVKNPIMADVPSFMYPMQTLAVDLIKSGFWPLWNPKILGGVPLLANFQSAPFSPTIFYYFIFNKTTAWTLQIITAHFLAAIFTFFLLKRWKVSQFGSILGAIVYAFSGYNLIWSQWNGHTLAASFLPLILLFTDIWLKDKNYFAGLGISTAVLFQILSGYPQTVIYTGICCGIYWAVLIWKQKERLVKTIYLFLFGILGFGLSAPQLLTSNELLKLSQWLHEPHPYLWAFLPFQKIITFLAPDYFGNHVTGNYWGPQDYTSNTGFVGVVAFTLALFSLSLSKKKNEVLFLVCLVLITLILSFPTPLSVFLWKNNILGMKASSAHRALVLFNLGMAALSSFGYDLLSRKRFNKKNLFLLIFPCLIFGGFGFSAFYNHNYVALRNLVLPVFILLAVFVVILVMRKFLWLTSFFCILELFYFGWKYTPFTKKDFVFPKTPVLEFISSQKRPFRFLANRLIPVNLAMPYDLETLEGYETMRPVRISQLISSINSNDSSSSPAGRYGIIDNFNSRVLDLANTKYYLSLLKDLNKFNENLFKVVFTDKSVAVLEKKTALPRSFVVFEWEVEKNSQKILDKLLSKNYPLERKIILEEDPGNIKMLYFVSDTYFPGWKAYVDGKETKIYRADFAFRAVPLENPDQKVEFIYLPDPFLKGLKISFFTAVFILGWMLYLRLRKR